MLKTSVKWEPKYYKEQGLPSHGCFGYINGQLILGNTHHQLIMGLLLHAGWTFEQLMEAEQAWGWFELNSASHNNDFKNAPDHLKSSRYVSVRFSSDAGFQQDEAMQRAVGAFSQMYHLPAKRDPYGTKGIKTDEGYGSGLSGKENLEHYVNNPNNYYTGDNFRLYFPAGQPPQPPDQDWDPNWDERWNNPEKQEEAEKFSLPSKNPGVKGKQPQDFPIGTKVRVLNNRWDAGVNVGDIGTVKGYGPDDDSDGVAVVFDKDNEVPWYFHPNDLQPIPQAPAPSAHLKQIAQEHFDKHGEHPLNGLYWTGNNFNIWGNGHSVWYDQMGMLQQPESPVAPDVVQKWINQKQMEKVDHSPYKMPSGLNGTYAIGDTGVELIHENGKSTIVYPNSHSIDLTNSWTPAVIQEYLDNGSIKKISSIWKEGYTPGGKTKGWGDIMEKANYIRQNNGVQILRNDPQHVVGQVQSGTDPQNKGPYQTEIWRDDPQSQAITMWDCDCDWDQYAWGRTRQWKKYEGRPCCHVLALFWDALTHPPQGAGGGEATPPTPTPGGGVTVNQGLIAPVGQPPIPNMPLIGPEGEPAPIGPEPAPQQAPWSEIVQPGKEEGTITFPGTFSHWKLAKVDIPDETREELEKFWHDHPDLRAECKKKYGYDPVDEADGYWPHGLGDEPEHHVIWDAVQDGPFTLELAKKWEKQELAAAKKESSAPIDPPNYRKSDKPNEKCGTCKMFFKGKCWGYGNKPVKEDMVCDSFSPESKKEAASEWWNEWDNQRLPEHGTFGFINGHLILGAIHHKAILGELLNAGWTWEQLMNAEQAWGWFATHNLSTGREISIRFVSDSGYQNEPAMEAAKKTFEEMYKLPVIQQGYVEGVEDEDSYGTGLGYQKAQPRENEWVAPVPPPPTASWKEAAFQNGDIVRTWETTQGYAQPAYGQPGYPVVIKKNQSGEVLSSDDELTVAIFPLNTGPLEHHLVKVECPTSNLYLDNTNAQPFIKKHTSLSHYEALQALQKEGGFSLTANKDVADPNGYFCALKGYEQQVPLDQLTPEVIKNYIQSHAQELASDANLLVGAWLNGAICYFDLAKKFFDLDEAMTAAKQNEQLAIWDGVHQQEIPVLKTASTDLNALKMFKYIIYDPELARGYFMSTPELK